MTDSIRTDPTQNTTYFSTTPISQGKIIKQEVDHTDLPMSPFHKQEANGANPLQTYIGRIIEVSDLQTEVIADAIKASDERIKNCDKVIETLDEDITKLQQDNQHLREQSLALKEKTEQAKLETEQAKLETEETRKERVKTQQELHTTRLYTSPTYLLSNIAQVVRATVSSYLPKSTKSTGGEHPAPLEARTFETPKEDDRKWTKEVCAIIGIFFLQHGVSILDLSFFLLKIIY